MAITDLIPWKREKVPIRSLVDEAEDEHSLVALQRNMNELFDEFFGLSPFGKGLWSETGRAFGLAFSPRVDVIETDKEFEVSAELPGLDAKDIDVNVSRHMLTIRGEKKEEKEEKGKNYYRAERTFGAFERTIPLPSEVDSEKGEASFKKGVLTIAFPKTSVQEDRKKITVKAQ